MRVSVTRHETVERHWECGHCKADGIVVVRAVGESRWKQVWFSRDEAESEAAEDARWAVQHDVDRICGLIRCPRCHRREPHVWLWLVLRNLIALLLAIVFGGGVAAIVVGGWGWPAWLGLPIVLGGITIALLPERRRWIEAAQTTVRNLQGGEPRTVPPMSVPPAALPVAVARTVPSKAESPRLEPVASTAPAEVERPADHEGPRFLKDDG